MMQRCPAVTRADLGHSLCLIETIFGDNKYHNHDLQAWMATHRPTWRLEVKTRPEGSTGFTPLRQRWVVERTNAWNGRIVGTVKTMSASQHRRRHDSNE